MTSAPAENRNPLASRRLLLLPAVLIVLLAVLPWILERLEPWFPETLMSLREAIETGITLLLGAWIISLLGYQQHLAREHLKELERLSLTDPLTGLGNRRSFEHDLARQLSRSRRHDQPLALLYLDVDGLKQLNDRYGHSVGDETLRSLAAVLRTSSRLGTDSAYRVGGDEFIMLLCADRSGAETIAGRIALSFPERSPHGSKVSMGVVVWDGKSSVSELIDEADSRMYLHKRPAPTYEWV